MPKTKIYNIYIWLLKKLGMNKDNKQEIYTKLLAQSKQNFNELQKQLGKGVNSENDSYLSFIKHEDNHLEFKIGSRRILLSYYFNLDKHIRYFKTQEIAINDNDYGKFKIIEIKDLNFESVPDPDNYFVDNKGGKIYFPVDYLERLERSFEMI